MRMNDRITDIMRGGSNPEVPAQERLEKPVGPTPAWPEKLHTRRKNEKTCC